LADRGHRVAVIHRGKTRTQIHRRVEQIFGDWQDLRERADELRRIRPEVVVDMIAFTERDAQSLVESFRGLARRLVVISSADVYRAYGRFLNLEPGPVEPTPIPEDAPLRTVLFPYRQQARGRDDFSYTYDKIPVERAVCAEPELPATVLRLP